MTLVFERSRAVVAQHRHAMARIGAVVLAGALGLLVVGGTIRVLRAADRDPAPATESGTSSPTWTATIDSAVTGLAVDEGRVYVASRAAHRLPGRPASRAAGPARPRWRGIVPDGPLSVPTVGDDRVFVGLGLRPALRVPRELRRGRMPARVGRRRRNGGGVAAGGELRLRLRHVRRAVRVPRRVCRRGPRVRCPRGTPTCPAVQRPALPPSGNGLVVVASSSTRGGVAAYPAVCGQGCEPVWTGRTDGPATSVAIGDGFAFTVARGQLMAFPLSCTGRCGRNGEGRSCRERPFASGRDERARISTPVACSSVTIEGRLWIFRSTCDERAMRPDRTPRGGDDAAAHPGGRRRPRGGDLSERRDRARAAGLRRRHRRQRLRPGSRPDARWRPRRPLR